MDARDLRFTIDQRWSEVHVTVEHVPTRSYCTHIGRRHETDVIEKAIEGLALILIPAN